MAGGFLYSHTAAAEESKRSIIPDLVSQQIQDNVKVSPELRAYCLLQLSDAYLKSSDNAATEKQFKRFADERLVNDKRFLSKWRGYLPGWCDELNSNSAPEPKSDANGGSLVGSRRITKENVALADRAAKTALADISKSSEPFAKLNLYFIAERYLAKVGDTRNARVSREHLENGIGVIESKGDASDAEIQAAVSALCSMSNQIFNVHISDWAPTSGSTFKVESVKHPSAAQFAVSEKLRLRALVLADKLPAANHERRKLHRDMVLWYQKLEKPDLAAAQKEELFSLVGFRDEGLLYPQPGACGAIVWWEKAFDKPSILCGMG